MNFPNLPLPSSENKKMKYIKQLKLEKLHRLRKEMQAKEVPLAIASARNNFLYAQELHNLNNEKMILEKLLEKKVIPYYNIDKIKARQELLKKLISS